MDQLAAITCSRLEDGPEHGVQVLTMRTGSGLSWEVLAGRGFDIGFAEYQGVPLAWQSGTGDVHSAYFEPAGRGWLRGFSGGLLTTCGLTYAGGPTVDGSEPLGLHGRASYIPASHVRWDSFWEGDRYVLRAEAQVRETSVFGPNLLLKRSIQSELGSKEIHIHDTVVNEGFCESPHMMLYHLNLGFPIISGASQLLLDYSRVDARDAESESWVGHLPELTDPVSDEMDLVFYPEVVAGEDGMVTITAFNPTLLGGNGLGVVISYPKAQLPSLTLWKSLSRGRYVLGVEPGNCRVDGRDKERARGTLVVLKPMETAEYSLTFRILDGREDRVPRSA